MTPKSARAMSRASSQPAGSASQKAPKKPVTDKLSVLAHCAKGGTVSFGPARAKPKATPAATPQSSFSLTPLVAPTPVVLSPAEEMLPEAEVPEQAIGGDQPSGSPKRANPYLGQYFGNSVPRLDGSSERSSMAPKLRSGEPLAKSYGAAKTLGEAVAPCYTHPPKWSFGGGTSRSSGLAQTDGRLSASLANLKRRPKRSLSRGFGSGRGVGRRPSASPGPGSYDLFRVGDEVPVWASGSRLPWGTRTGGRSKLGHSQSDVGPGEYTAQQGLAFGPAPKIGQKIQELPDSRIEYPAPGHYPLGSTLCPKKPYKKGSPSPGIMGSGQRSTMSSKDDGPGFVYHPGVEPTTTAQFWSTGERKSWMETDPDEPPGPGAYDLGSCIDDGHGQHSGWPKDEKQFRKMAGLLPENVPAPKYLLPSERLGWTIGFRGRLAPPKEEEKLSPAAYHPNMELVTHCAGVPKPLHRTAERRSIFEVGGNVEGAAEALVKRALLGLSEAKAEKPLEYETSGPRWSLVPRRAPLKTEEPCAAMYGPWSSIN